MRIDDSHVVVVGGSRGIGRAVAQRARQRGARVTVMARDATRLQSTAAAIGAAAVAVDVTDETAVAHAFAALDRVDHVYVAAGQFVGGSVFEGDLGPYRTAFEARLWGAVHVARAVRGRLPQGGSIVLTGGVSTDRPLAGAWATAVATAAAEQLARTLALALAPVRCNAVAPGWTDTPLWDDVFGNGKADAFAGVAAKLPVGRIAAAEEVADAVLFLMDNPSITGEVVHVDGGHRLS